MIMTNRQLTTALTVLVLLTPFSFSLHAQQSRPKLPDDVDHRKVDIISEGTRMTGHIFAPKSVAAKKLATIVMAQGWGGRQSSLFRDAVEFAQSGYLVLTFDYRGWGESDSRVILTQAARDPKQLTFKAEVRAIREVVDPMDMGTDWLNVLHWVQGEPQVDADRIGIWGSSMAGGYAIYAAAHDPRVKAVHSQVTGTLDGLRTGYSQRARQLATLRARGDLGYPEPLAKYGSLRGAPISHRFAGYRPGEDILTDDKVALQIVLAEKEQYGGNPKAVSTYEAYQGPKNLVIIPGINHYDIYTKARQQAHDLALTWFDEYLRGGE